MGAISLEVPAHLDEIHPICEAVQQAAQEAGFDDRTAYACQLAVSEACENIVVHGYGRQAEGTIRANLESEPGNLRIHLTDRAPPFNPAQVQAGPPVPPEDPPAGGLGLYILHRVMDEVAYERNAGENRLTLRKSVPALATD